MTDRQTVDAMLKKLLPWVEGRCRYLAGQINHPTLHDDDLQGEIYDRVLETFLKRTAAGWFDQNPRINLEAQVRNLLTHCLKSVRTDLERDAKKVRATMPPAGPDGASGDEAPEDKLPDTTGPDNEILERMVEDEDLDHVVRAARHLNAPQRLYFLALYCPQHVLREYIHEAHAFEEGGARTVVRDPDATWDCFVAMRRRWEDLEDASWKKWLAQLFRLETPIGEADADTIRRIVSAYDQQLTRARRGIVAWLKRHHMFDPEPRGPRGNR